MSMRVSASDGVKVYNICSGKAVPQWLSESKKKSLKKNEEYRRRLELLQDLKFPAACQRIKVTPDQQYIFATGYHPPQAKVYDLANLALKFDRHLDSEVVDFQILSEDYSKAAFLCADRTVCFHARFGSYHKTRVPRAGRDLAYCPFTAELLVAGSAPEVWRISLAEGRYMTPLPCRSPAINATGLSPVTGLLAVAGEDGQLECFDLRARTSLACFNAAASAGAAGQELTALRFDDTGLQLAVGTRNGLVAVFDMRSQRPLLVKDHMYGSPIVDIKFHMAPGDASGASRRIISSDRHIVKIWDVASGSSYTSVQPAEGDINDVCVWPGSGLIMVGCDASTVQGYFIPSLGPAPRWCAHLEALTEEMEEAAPAVYDDYRFVTKADLVRLGLEHLVGTALLRAYMHGFFIDNRLYHKAKALTEPFAYEVYRQQRIAKKMEEERASRISLVKKLPKVNTRVAAKLVAQDEEARAAAAGDTAAQAALKKKGLLAPDGSASLANPLADDRFKAMFEDTDFAVDEGAEEYKALHPNAEHRKSKRDETDLLMEHFEELSGSGASSSASEDEDDVLFKTGRQGDSSSDEEDGDRRSRQPAARHGSKAGLGKGAALHAVTGGVQKHKAGQGGKGPAMFAAKDVASLQAFQKKESKADLLSQTFAERVAMQGQGATTARRVGGSREIVFRPSDGFAGNRGRGRGRGRAQMGAGRNDGGDDDAVGSERGRGGGRGGRGRSSRGRGSSGRGRTGGSRGRGRGR
ncbi:WD40-repeat-containing domain protein [Haematococcus lacustris]